jgi:hypothetical protein
MDNFEIAKEIEKASKGTFYFRKDEIKYLTIKSNKEEYNKVFNNPDPKIKDVEKYIFNFFNKIQHADFPLGHKYINLNLEDNEALDNEDLDFFYICKEFFNSLLSYKNSKEEENYV